MAKVNLEHEYFQLLLEQISENLKRLQEMGIEIYNGQDFEYAIESIHSSPASKKIIVQFKKSKKAKGDFKNE